MPGLHLNLVLSLPPPPPSLASPPPSPLAPLPSSPFSLFPIPICLYPSQCSKSPSKCLKFSTTFIGDNLSGTTAPTVDNCAKVTAPYWPNPNKPYYTPADPADWAARTDLCADVPFVPHGQTAKPDIYPFFYAPLNTTDFPTACYWLERSLAFDTPLNKFAAVFKVGKAAGFGWANANGYCAE